MDLEAKRKYQRELLAQRRKEWFDKNGPCIDCGTWENLELDHIDPSTKIHHSIWSWSKQRRDIELAKCAVRCENCHSKKSVKECFERGIYGMFKKTVVNDKLLCKKCNKILTTENFTKDKQTATGFYAVCRNCRKSYKGR